MQKMTAGAGGRCSLGTDVLCLGRWGKQAGLRSLQERPGLGTGQELPLLGDARLWGDPLGMDSGKRCERRAVLHSSASWSLLWLSLRGGKGRNRLELLY